MTIYAVENVGMGWSQITISVDDEGNATGGVLVPTEYVDALIAVADDRRAKEGPAL